MARERPHHVYVHVPFCRARCDYCDFFSEAVGAPAASGASAVPHAPAVPGPGSGSAAGGSGRRSDRSAVSAAGARSAVMEPACDGRDALLDRYVDALLAEWDLERAALGVGRTGAARLHTVFLGGGTPSLLGADRLERLLGAFDGHLTEQAEVTVETNPEDVTAGYAKWAAGRGIRVSLGAQSFVPRLRAALGRRTQADPAAAFRRLRTAGCTNVGVDLIFGIPGQTADELEADLAAVAQLRPDHVSWYELDVVESTALAARLGLDTDEVGGKDPIGAGGVVRGDQGTAGGAVRPDSARGALPGDEAERDGSAMGDTVRPDGDTRAAMYRTVVRGLERLGYRWYEVSNFALPGRRCRHNSAVWRGEDYLGLGAGAVGTIGGRRRRDLPDLAGHLAALTPPNGSRTRGGGRRPQAPPREIERLAAAERARERLYLAARTGAALPLRDVQEVLDSGAIGPLAQAGFVRLAGGTLRVTRKGRFVADELSVRLFRDSCVQGTSEVPPVAARGSASQETE
jgi:oxygen-independent coproporphyrinogen-3 oxidase